MTDSISFALEQVAAWDTRLRRLVSPTAEESALEIETFDALLASQRLAQVARQPGLPDALLRSRLGLTNTELDCLWLLAALALSPEARASAVALHGGTGDPTASTLHRLVYRGTSIVALRELSGFGNLRKLGLIERCDGGGALTHESHWTWAIAPRVLQFLHDPEAKDDSLSALARPMAIHTLDDLAADANAIETAKGAFRAGSIVMATGLPGLGRRSMLVAIAAEAGRHVIEIDLKRASKDSSLLTSQLRAIARECRLLDLAPLVTNLDALEADRGELIVRELVSVIDGCVLVTCGLQRPRIEWTKPLVVVEMSPVTSAQRRALWREALGDINDKDVEHLVTHYPLAPSLLVQSARAAKARAAESSLSADHIHAGIRAVLDDRLGHFAKRVMVTQTWDDLVLPDDQISSVLELMARIRERRRVYEDWGFAAKVGKGLGTSALFSGPPGTGKTMVAALIAKDLGLELYQVDLGKIVSKYIGETEKNLAALFDAAEAGHAVLLFDEADSLFGKRTEVKSSNDRYANLETNYLLQRLESFTGICLLTSNHETNIDPAFLRRLSLHLRFELPDVEERAHLWRAMLPKQAPVDDNVDVELLAKRYAMSGGYIRNAALRAAFLAANDDSAITVAHLERAARSEYEGMGKIVAS